MKLLSKKYLVVSALITGVALSSFAFAYGGGKHADRIAEKLSLTEDQKVQFTDIVASQKDKRREIKKELFELKQEKMQAVQEETRSALTSVLSPEQLSEYDEMVQKRQEKHRKYAEKREGKHHKHREH